MQCKRYEDFMREYKYYRSFLWKYRKTKKPFHDHYFHPRLKIYEAKVDLDPNKIEWKRVDEVYKAPLLDKKLINIDYVQQGSLGDCYFMAAISRIAKQPELVLRLFDKTANTILGSERNSVNLKCGAVVIFFHAFGRQTPVLIDTYLPFRKGTNNLIFSHPSNTHVSPWFCLVEKAYAKLFGSYSNIVGGHFSYSIYSLFGYQPHQKEITDLFKEKKWTKKSPFDRIVEYHGQGSVISAAINPSKTKATKYQLKNSGLVVGHAYLLEKAIEYNDMHFFRLRNPWGCHEWKGDWSDDSPLWTREMREALKVKKKDDGTFYMIDNDFYRYFTSIDISRPIPEHWHSKTFSIEMRPGKGDGCMPDDVNLCLAKRPNYSIKVSQKVPKGQKIQLFFLYERRFFFPDRVKNIKESPSPFIFMFVFSNGKKLTHSVLKSSQRTYINCQSTINAIKFEIKNKSDILTVAIQRIEKRSMHEECSIRVSCKYDFDLYEIDHPDDLIEDNDDTGSIFKNFVSVHQIAASKEKVQHQRKRRKNSVNNRNHDHKHTQKDRHRKRRYKQDNSKSETDDNDNDNSESESEDESEEDSIDLGEIKDIDKEKAQLLNKSKALAKEKVEIQKDVTKITSKALKLQKEVDQIINDIDNEEDQEKIDRLNKLADMKRNKLENLEEKANKLMDEIDIKEEEMLKTTRIINKIKKLQINEIENNNNDDDDEKFQKSKKRKTDDDSESSEKENKEDSDCEDEIITDQKRQTDDDSESSENENENENKEDSDCEDEIITDQKRQTDDDSNSSEKENKEDSDFKKKSEDKIENDLEKNDEIENQPDKNEIIDTFPQLNNSRNLISKGTKKKPARKIIKPKLK